MIYNMKVSDDNLQVFIIRKTMMKWDEIDSEKVSGSFCG